MGLVTCGGLASTSGGSGNIRFMLRRLGYAPELGDPLESSGKLPFILRKSVVELGSIETQCLYSKQWDTWTGLQGNSYDYERIAFDSTSRGLRGWKWIVNVLRRYFSRFDQGKYFISSFFMSPIFFFLYFSTALELSTTVQVTRALMSKTSCPHEPVVKKQRLNGLRVVDVQFTLSYREFLFHYDINSA